MVKPFLFAFTRRDWRGIENIPRQGGVIAVANHVSEIDPLTLAHPIYDGAKRLPRYLAKSELFAVPVVGWLLHQGRQIPVYRRSRDAANALRDAEAAVADGELVAVFPEGTCTRDPDGWPMVGKTGVARLALATDAPVVPIAHWGAHRLLGYRSKRPNLFPRKVVTALAGPPIDLSTYREKYGPGKEEAPNDVLREVTDLLMTRVKELLGEIREETPPAGFFQPGHTSGAGLSAAKRTGVA